MTRTRIGREGGSGIRTSVRILAGCIGLSLIVIGLAVMGIEVSSAPTLGEWRTATLLDVARSSYGQQVLPESLSFWLAMPRTFKGLRDVVVWVLDFTPVWLGSAVIGGVILWKALKS